MLSIENNRITLTRGDNASVNVDIKDINGEDYEFKTGDKLILTVKKHANDTEELIKITAYSNTIDFSPEDTKNLNFGTYEFDLQLIMSNGNIYTIVPCEKFIIGKEVGW